MPTNPRYDPERRDRIIDACLDVIAERGVAGTTHRRVAEAAGVPLGSMTYHFAGMDELLREAFTRFSHSIADGFEARLGHEMTREQAEDAVVDLIQQDVFAGHRELVLSHELYTLAARDERYRELTSAWMARSRVALERHFDPVTAQLLDAMIEGVSIHSALDVTPTDRALIREAVRRIAR
ncbi:TetR/AcrR family transcriptional regulator [Microbacterium sp. CIAB417]|uniref:TetR/AcrR family transcriptional regulator n=1 Tax=Microbacterium sp. CIAB417 TaxID=2860287 RepID=UPI001FAE36F4|nr:TetR family transcriptional regulator [Microbacterium sp. CIAB417]